MPTKPDEYDLLGGQLLCALAFARSGFSLDERLLDHVREETFSAREMFELSGKRYFMTGDSLPGDAAVKAIGVDARALYLETSPLSPDDVKEVLKSRRLAVSFRESTHTFVTLAGKPLATVTTGKVPSGTEPRCLWTILWRTMRAEDLELALKVTDAVYSHSAWQQEESRASVDGATRTMLKRDFELSLEIVQMLQLEQRPILSLEMAGILTQRLELRMLQRVERQLLDATPEEIRAYAERDLSPEGQRKTMQVFLFVLARRLKEALKDKHLSWKQARRLVRQAVSKKS